MINILTLIKNSFLLILFFISFSSYSQVNESEFNLFLKKIQNEKVDSLIIISWKKSDYNIFPSKNRMFSFLKPNNDIKFISYLAYKKSDSYYLVSFIGRKKNIVTERRIGNGIFKVYNMYSDEIIKSLRNKRDARITKDKLNDSIILTRVYGGYHGNSYGFRVIVGDLDVSKTFCCSLGMNYFFLDRELYLWFLMSAFLNEYPPGTSPFER